MMLDKKANLSSFLIRLQMGHKAAETTHNINNTSGSGTANEHAVQQWFRKFCKGDQSLEDEECSGQQSEADNNQLRALSKLIPLQLHKLPKNSVSAILWSLAFEANWEGEKA